LCEVTCAVKNTSVWQANLIVGRTGLRFWQDESCDHWVRDGQELERIVRYIEGNPVRAGLIERAEMWPWWSFANHCFDRARQRGFAGVKAGTGGLS
jgi:putative transposase